jgi:hypothetical protein
MTSESDEMSPNPSAGEGLGRFPPPDATIVQDSNINHDHCTIFKGTNIKRTMAELLNMRMIALKPLSHVFPEFPTIPMRLQL